MGKKIIKACALKNKLTNITSLLDRKENKEKEKRMLRTR